MPVLYISQTHYYITFFNGLSQLSFDLMITHAIRCNQYLARRMPVPIACCSWFEVHVPNCRVIDAVISNQRCLPGVARKVFDWTYLTFLEDGVQFAPFFLFLFNSMQPVAINANETNAVMNNAFTFLCFTLVTLKVVHATQVFVPSLLSYLIGPFVFPRIVGTGLF